MNVTTGIHTNGVSDLLRTAIEYHNRGLCIIPVRDKVSVGHWDCWQHRRPTEAELRQMFRASAITGLAAVGGPVSGGIACRDFDVLASYENWADRNSRLAAVLPTVQTLRGRRHVWFATDVHEFIDLGDGEYRGDSQHYTLLPPSSGGAYRWLVPMPDGPLPSIDPCNAGLLERFTEERDREDRGDRDTEKTEQSCALDDAQSSLCLSVSLSRWTAAVLETQPRIAGERNRRLFDLARALKAIPELQSLPAGALRPILKRWHETALPVVATKDFDETWAEFCYSWRKVLRAKDAGLLAEMASLVRVTPVPPEAMAYDADTTRRLISLCRELQAHTGREPFFLTCRDAARIAGLADKNAAHRRLAMLVTDGLLEAVHPGNSTRAARFRYIGVTKRIRESGTLGGQS